MVREKQNVWIVLYCYTDGSPAFSYSIDSVWSTWEAAEKRVQGEKRTPPQQGHWYEVEEWMVFDERK